MVACGCELMATKLTPAFPDWIPPAARDRILDLRQREIASMPEESAMLDRLATYEEMHTEVWQKLPPSAAGMEGWIIDWTVAGLRLAAAMKPTRLPFTKRKAQFAERLVNYPGWTAQDAATLARTLLEAMDENRQYAEGTWDAHSQTTWPGRTLSYLEARNIVDRLTHFFEVLWAQDKFLAAALQVPRIRKKQAANAKEVFLSRFLSQRFINQFDDPYDPIVSALVGVALDSAHGPDAATIRGRRRRQRKISSKKQG
jgi:hypothetical protein